MAPGPTAILQGRERCDLVVARHRIEDPLAHLLYTAQLQLQLQ